MMILFIVQILAVQGRTCLPEAVQEADRQNITISGESTPIKVTNGDWESAQASRYIYEILVSEVLGYNVQHVDTSGSSNTLRHLAGCKDSNTALENCTFPPVAHVGVEIWQSALSSDAWLAALASLRERSPKVVGSMGFSGIEGIYVLGQARERSRRANGMHPAYYGNLNASWFDPTVYAATVADVNQSLISTCASWSNDRFAAQLYFDATGDADAVMDGPGGLKAFKCYNDKWFVLPACRATPTNCLSVVTGGSGWGLTEMIQQAFFHNIPMAFARAWSSDDYRTVNKEIQSFLYWWKPDASFVQYNAALVEFPPYNLQEYRQGIFQSQMGIVELSWATASGFDVAADRAFALVQGIDISDSIMQSLLVDLVDSPVPDAWDTACRWLQTHRNIWAAWVPDQTKCSIGRGLVDLQGDFTSNLTRAVDCAICPAGRASTELQNTRVCSQCTAGSYQSTFGMSECTLCEAGTISATAGRTECEQCGLGEYANATGMSSCLRCGNGTGQEQLWTTSQEVMSQGEMVVIQLLGSVAQSFCACEPGTFMWEDRCQVCKEGTNCPGSNRLELLPGYFSTPQAPGAVFKCYEEFICPGGLPGTCAEGRDPLSVACATCKEGYQKRGNGTCGPCRDGDYIFVILVGLAAISAVIGVYYVLANEKTGRDQGSVLVIASAFAQCITTLQILSVIRRFDINWREPFESLLWGLEILSFDVDMFSVNCVSVFSPVGLFTFRCLMIPMLMCVALAVHLIWILISRAKSFKTSNLLRTCGTVFLILFIVLFSMLLAPFQCNSHPNGSLTMKRYKTVFCNGEAEHWEMFLIGGVACLMPIGFLVACTYVVLVEMPKRVARSDTRFLAACSFLTKRFRPGMEMSSVFLLIRNALVVVCPLIEATAGQLLMMSIVLTGNLILVAFYKPWRFAICNWLDNALLTSLLVVVQVGSVTVSNPDPQATMIVAMTFVIFMGVAVLTTVAWGGYRFCLQKYQKQFRFFTCHQKSAAGSMARLLKMELEARLPGTKTFLDCDDLNDLTRLFSYVGQDTQTFLVLCSPAILTRKWCVGEMVNAKANKVQTLLVTWPGFSLPDEKYIENYASLVPDISELVKHGINLSDVNETFQWLRSQSQVAMPDKITPSSIDGLSGDLVSVSKGGTTRGSPSIFGHESRTNFPILVDPADMESVSTALVLASMLKPGFANTDHPMPSMLQMGWEVPRDAAISVIICTNESFRSEQIQTWLLQACDLPQCCMIPIIADDPFLLPTKSFFDELRSKSSLDEEQLQLFSLAVQALFQEIAVVFVPQGYFSTQSDLELRASQAFDRLTAKLQPLKDKVVKLQRLQSGKMDEAKAKALAKATEAKNQSEVKGEDSVETHDSPYGGVEEEDEPMPLMTQTF